MLDTLHHLCLESEHLGDESVEHSFETAFSNSLHGNIVLKSHAKQCLQKDSLLREALPSHAPVPSLDTNAQPQVPLPDPLPVPAKRLIAGTVKKNAVLKKYEAQFARSDGKSIITQKKGEITPPSHLSNLPTQRQLVRSSVMKPSLKGQYRVEDLCFHNVVITLIKEGWFNREELNSLLKVNTIYRSMVPEVLRLLTIDFRPLRLPRTGYEDQTELDPHRIDMASAAMIHYDSHPGKVIRFINGELTGEDRPRSDIFAAVKAVVSESDFKHIKRILTEGCPASLHYWEDSASKLAMMERGNQKNFIDNPDVVKKTINKEDRYSHLLPIHPFFCFFSAFLRHNSQGMVITPGKSPRLVWDGSTKRTAMDVVMNEITTLEDEAEITFGDVKLLFYAYLYNMRISYPNADILLAMADVKACFRFPRMRPDLAGAFGFLADIAYCLATAMVFGSNTSATSWEPFRRAIEALTVVFANRPDLVIKHKDYLDMIRWDIACDDSQSFVRAKQCRLQPGIIDTITGAEKTGPSRIYVDDALLAARNKKKMEMALASTLEAIFTVMGHPNTRLRQCPVAMDKWQDLVVAPWQTMLGLRLNTCRLSVAILPDYRAGVLALLNSPTWRPGRCKFHVGQAQTLVGKLSRLAEGAYWVHHLLSHMYTSIAHALAKNTEFLNDSSVDFRRLVNTIRANNYKCSEVRSIQGKTIRFAMKEAAKKVHHCKREFFINRTMRLEIEFFREYLSPNSGIDWETPLGLMIKRTPFARTFGDACLHGAGGYSLELKFWWHMEFEDDIVQRTLLHKKDNSDGDLISINVLEFFTVIINYCGALTVFMSEETTDDPNPVLLNVTDNTSALNWTVHNCKSSMIGRMLARFFCCLLMDSPMGINSEWIATDDNELADEISRLRKKSSHIQHFRTFDYSSLQQKYSVLKACRFFQPSQELICMINAIVLHMKWPNLAEVRTLKQKGLGKLISSCGVEPMEF